MTFPALDLVALATRIKGVGAGGLGWSGGGVFAFKFSGTVTVEIEFRTDGSVGLSVFSDGNYSGSTVWIQGAFDPADYEIKATMISGTTTPTGDIPFGSFIALSSNRELRVVRSVPGLDEAFFTIEIREILVPANSTSAQGSLIAELST